MDLLTTITALSYKDSVLSIVGVGLVSDFLEFEDFIVNILFAVGPLDI